MRSRIARPADRSGVGASTQPDNSSSASESALRNRSVLVLPDLFQERLAKLTEQAAHVDMLIGAIAQHDLRVTPVAPESNWLVERCSRGIHRSLRSAKSSSIGQ